MVEDAGKFIAAGPRLDAYLQNQVIALLAVPRLQLMAYNRGENRRAQHPGRLTDI